MKFICPLLTVADIATSRDFYVRLLGRSVTADYGANIEIDRGFSLHERGHFRGLINRDVSRGKNDVELYFEDDDLQALEARLRTEGAELMHGVIEQPWRQRALRFLDPDGYVIEVGEPLQATVARLAHDGLSLQEICRATGLGEDFVRASM